MKYTLMGNFQYDLGVFGLKKVLDFFEEKYETDEKYYIIVDKTPEELFELVLLKLIYDKPIQYFLRKIFDDKELKNQLKDKSNILKDFDFNSIDKKKLVYEKNVNKICELYSNIIPDLIELEDKERIFIELKAKFISLLNNILLNFQADNSKVNRKKSYELAVSKLDKNFYKSKSCSYCKENPGKEVTRDSFFFAPSQLNASWFNEIPFMICPYCLVSNLAITQALYFFGNSSQNALAIYRSNLKDLEELYQYLETSKPNSIGKLTPIIINYEKALLCR
ncbi:MAG: hypothetical protein OEV44_06090 [Spirochaetota bacterium]|nr:hypothetical protein [Spirochaetota bacterium]